MWGLVASERLPWEESNADAEENDLPGGAGENMPDPTAADSFLSVSGQQSVLELPKEPAYESVTRLAT